MGSEMCIRDSCVTVEDMTSPVVTCPADTLILMAGDSCNIGLPDYTDLVSVQDSCAGDMVTCVDIYAVTPHSSYAAFSDGSFYAWGWNGNDQLGLGVSTVSVLSPMLSPYLNNVVSSSGTRFFGHAVLSDGTLWGWGVGTNLGNGTTTGQPTPVQIGTDTDWASVEAVSYTHLTLPTKRIV